MSLRLELDDLLCEVGGAFTGRVMREADADGVNSDSRARAVRLVLRMRTEGRGDTDTSEITIQTINLESHGGLNSTFSLSVSGGTPISYDGNLMRVLYEVEARVDMRLARDPKIKQSVLIVPQGGLGVYEQPHPLPPRLGEHQVR